MQSQRSMEQPNGSVSMYCGPAPMASAAAATGQGGAGRAVLLCDRYMMCEELGRGAYGQVFKAVESTTGTTVAIKQISLVGTSGDNLTSVMSEIELLKSLNNRNIVQYLGSFKTRHHLYIILEYMELGSLASIVKQCGPLSEELVAVYITQVLRGLHYLHSQGVVHRDIKGANILTNKDGVVKLADFGVAAKLGELEERRGELQQHVVGTPYWMAPEVIEMTQVTPASDIWSVGCLVLEVLTGSPPYYDLQPMSALFRVVRDRHPPLPPGISRRMEDFLMLCFQKDPKKRPDALTLLQHEWCVFNSNTLRRSWRGTLTGRPGSLSGLPEQAPGDAHECVESVVNRMLAAESSDEELAGAGPGLGASAAAAAAPAAAGALLSSGSAATPLLLATGSVPLPPMRAARAGGHGAATSPAAAGRSVSFAGAAATVAGVSSSDVQAAAASAAAPHPLSEVVASLQGLDTSLPSCDSGGVSPSGAAATSTRGGGTNTSHGGPNSRDGTVRLYGLGVSSAGNHKRGSSLSALLDEGGGGEGASPEPPTTSGAPPGLRTSGIGSNGDACVHTSASLRSDVLRCSGAEAERARSEAEAEAGGGTTPELRRKVCELVSALRPTGAPGASGATLAALPQLAELPDDPHSSSVFLDEGGALVLFELLDTDEPAYAEGALRALAALSAREPRLLRSACLVGALPPVIRLAHHRWPAPVRVAAADLLEALCTQGDDTLRCLIAAGGLKGDDTPRCLITAGGGLKALVSLLWDLHGPRRPGASLESPRSLAHVGLRCLWRVLESYQDSMPLNSMCRLLAQAGLMPRLFCVIKEAIECQRAKGGFTRVSSGSPGPAYGMGSQQGTHHSLHQSGSYHQGGSYLQQQGSYQAAVSSRGSTLLGAHPQQQQRGQPGGSSRGTPGAMAMAMAAPMAGGAFHPAAAAAKGKLHGGGGDASACSVTPPDTPARNADQAAHITSAPVAVSMSHGIEGGPGGTEDVGTAGGADDAAAGGGEGGDGVEGGAVAVVGVAPLTWLLQEATKLLLVMSQTDAVVKGFVCTPDNLAMLLDSLEKLQQPHLVRLMKSLRWLSSEHAVLPAIKDSGAIYKLVPFLSAELEGCHGHEVSTEALHALYSICMFNKRVHLEAAAMCGVMPHLSRLAKESVLPALTTPQRLAAWPRTRGLLVPMLIGMVSCSPATRQRLWGNDGLDIFLQLLREPDTQVQTGVLAAVDTWLALDHTRVEGRLTQQDAVASLASLYTRVHQAPEAQPVVPQLLDTLRQMIGRSPALAVSLVNARLVDTLLSMLIGAAPILRVKLLEIIRCLYEHYPKPKQFVLDYRIREVLQTLMSIKGPGMDAVHSTCEQLQSAFHINVLF